MINRIATAAALSLLLATSALAQSASPPAASPPAAGASEAAPAATPTAPAAEAAVASTPEDCIATAVQLGQSAEGKAIPEAKLDQLDDLFTKLEKHCDAKQFSEAASVAGDIKSLLGTQ